MVYGLTYVPYLGNVVKFMGTWAHEWGHGIGAQITGGKFIEFIVTPRLGGLAKTASSNDFQRISTLVTGLLAPSLMGGFLLILTRRSGLGKLVLGLLAAGLAMTGIIWAGNMFTRFTLLGLATVFALSAWKASPRIAYYFALVVSIAMCINAVAKVDYFFSRGGVVDGWPYRSDVNVLSQILGFFPEFWGVIMTVISFSILYIAFRLSHLGQADQKSTTA